MDDNAFKLSLRLQQLSAIVVAVNIWELPAVKKEIRNLLRSYKTKDGLVNNWDKAVECALRQIKFILPGKLLCDIENLVKILGLNLYCWLHHAFFHLNFITLLCTEKVYWTCIGTVDAKRIVKGWLQNEEILQKTQQRCSFKEKMFSIALMYVEEDFIHDHLEEMKNEINKHIGPYSELNDIEIRALWLLWIKHKSKTLVLPKFETYRKSNALANQLFYFCVRSRFLFAAQYFFTCINNDKKQEAISFIIDEGLRECKNDSRSKSNSGVEILIFLIKNMDNYRKLEFTSQNFLDLFDLFLHKWPWQEVCYKFLMNDVSYLPGIHDKILEKMVKGLGADVQRMKYYKIGIRHYPYYTQIFKILLQRVPAEVKKRIFTIDNFTHLLSLKIINCELLNLIVNDPDLQHCRNEKLFILEKHLKILILEGVNYRNVNRMMEICSVEDKQKYNSLRTFLLSGRLEEAKNHLDWLADSEVEKTVLKNQIDVQTILNFFIRQEKYDFAKKYLKWQCENEEEIKNTKNMFFSQGVLRDQIFEIWCAHTNGALNNSILYVKNKCDKLLKWFFESDADIIEFRKTKLIENMDEFMIIRKYWNNLLHHSSFSGFGQFLEFCFWSPDEVDGLKEKIASNAEWWIDTYVVKEGYFLMVDSLFKWVFENDTERKNKIISDYMESPKGALLLLKSLKDRNSKTFSDLLNNWIRPHRFFFIYGIKIHLDALKSDIGCEHAIFGIKSLLDVLNKGNMITDSVLSHVLYSKLRNCSCENKFCM